MRQASKPMMSSLRRPPVTGSGTFKPALSPARTPRYVFERVCRALIATKSLPTRTAARTCAFGASNTGVTQSTKHSTATLLLQGQGGCELVWQAAAAAAAARRHAHSVNCSRITTLCQRLECEHVAAPRLAVG
eukprot:GHRQ01018410.1.p1 GENE.GHRQ01018410.1~~GHRQ01018410.1.p1  ORF type:complete len:133 (-),score=14.32 GHRQ01018410.1:554-952(-)